MFFGDLLNISSDNLKIAIIDSSDTWYAQPILIYNELLKMGHDVIFLGQPNHLGYKKKVVPEGYVMICIANNLSPIDVFSDKPMQLNHPPLERAYYSEADIVFIGDKTTFLNFFAHRPNAYYMPYAVNEVFSPLNLKSEFDLSFIGNIKFKERTRRLELLKNHFNIFIGNNHYMENANLSMNKSKIIFNTCDGKEINMRIFEALGTGRLLITENIQYLDELFIDGKHLVTYNNDEELISKITYYLNNDYEREEIARNGNAEVLSKHTYKHRAKFIIDKILQSGLSYNHKTSYHILNNKKYKDFYEKQSSVNTTAQERIFDFSIPDPDSDGKYDIRNRLNEALKVAKGKVLDIGCQRGGYSYNLKKAGCSVTAIDISLGYVKQAKEKVKEVDFSQANAENMPFKSDIFDSIILSEVLEHVPDEKKVVDEVYQILKPGGCVFVTVPAYEDDTEEHVRFLNKQSLANIFQDFSIEFRDNYNLKSTIMIATKKNKKNLIISKPVMQTKIKVLLTNHHLLDYTGSEVYTLTLAKYLKANHCDVVVYSRYVDKIEKEFIELDIPVVNHLEEIENIKFDIAHVHHSITAAEVRYFFPDLPIVFLSHGILPFLEQPSVFDLNISHYLAVSEEVKQNLIKKEIHENKVTVIGNVIDTTKFIISNPINPEPQKVLVISAKINDEKVQVIKQVCDKIGLEYRFVGGRFGEVKQDQLFKLISEADIVFSLGRGVIEAMLCEKAVIVFDSNGGDGMVTPENFDEIRKHNFSGRKFNKDFSVEDLIGEIKKYNPQNIKQLYKNVYDLYSAEIVIPRLINIYNIVIDEGVIDSKKNYKKVLEGFYNSLQETKNYTTILTQRKLTAQKGFKNNTITKEQVDQKTDLKINQLLSKIGFYYQKKENQVDITPIYDILIPIYNAYDHVKTCVESVLRSTDSKHKVYLLDDASPDTRMLPMLNRFAEKDKRVVVLSSEKNLGFIGNMNRGFVLSSNDVIILNSDTQVTPLWIERMHRCVSSNPKAGIVSPLSNNATILSVPEMNSTNKLPDNFSVDDFARLVDRVSFCLYPEIPTAVGFCMLIKRIVLDEVGLFDPIFGLGYGEENDLCERAKQKGYKILCCDDAYVHHYGEASFSFVDKIDDRKINNQKIFNEKWPDYEKEVFAFCRFNPLREIQERIYSALNSKGKKHILHVMHNFDAAGGTELHTRNIIDGLASEFDSTVIYPATLGYTYIDAKSKKIAEHLREVKFAKENNLAVEHFGGLPADLYSTVIEENFIRFLNGGNYDIVHFQHLSGWSTLMLPIIAKRMGKKVILSLHDFYLLCPELNLIYSYSNQRCGKNISNPNDKSCLYCLGTKRYNRYPDKAIAIEDYLIERNYLIQKVIESTDLLIVPSNFVKEKFQSAFSTLILEKIYVVPHGIFNLKKIPVPQVSKKIRVGFLGNATDRKGIYVFLDAVKKLQKQDFEFEIFGNASTEMKEKCSELKINVIGGYKTQQLPQLLQKVDLLIIASIVDETFSLTLSEAILMGIPVLSSDAGALKERIKDGKTGFLFRTGDAANLMEKLLFIKKNPSLLKEVRKTLENINVKSMTENIEDYRKIYLDIISRKELVQNTMKSVNSFASVPVASIIVLTYNALEYTKKFYESTNQYSRGNFELIFVDNASTDETKDFLNSVLASNKKVKVIYNDINLGFPAAVNQGIQAAKGKYILIANNDIVVTEGWLERLIEVAETDSRIGIVGPISNEVSGLQKDKEAKYKTIEEMHLYAASVKEKNNNKVLQFPRVAFLCTLIKREVIEKIGGLDERFSPGNFEDDDFCLRAQLTGYKTVIAQDVFIHHFGSKSFKADGEKKYAERLKVNHQIFVEKWGADPDEIWLKQKLFNHSRSLFISIDKDEFIKTFERAQNNIKDKEFDLALNELELSIENFEISSKVNSIISKEDLYSLTANISLIVKDLEKAKTYFEEALKLNPASSDACFGLGQVFYQAEMFEESKTMIEWAVKNNSENTKALEALKSVNEVLSLPENHNSLFEKVVEQVEAGN